MYHNWITTGDENSYLEVRGLLYLSEEEMEHWQTLALDNIRAFKSQEVMEYIKRNPYITIGALFFRGCSIKHEDFEKFVEDVCVEFGDVKPVLCTLDLGNKRKRNIISITFASGSIQDFFSKTKRDELRLLSIS